jgi:hypothetical protein
MLRDMYGALSGINPDPAMLALRPLLSSAALFDQNNSDSGERFVTPYIIQA